MLETLFILLYFLFFIFLIKKWKVFQTPFVYGWGYAAVFAVKFIIAIVLWEIHIRFFGDAYSYLNEATMLNEIWHSSPLDYLKLLTGIGENLDLILKHIPETRYWTNSGLYNDAKNTIRFDAILAVISFGNIYIQLMWASLLTLVGMKSIFDTLMFYIKKNHIFIFFAVLLFPSISFWGASFLKETYLILGFGLFFKACFLIAPFKKRLLPFIFGLFFLICVKPYVLITLIPALLFFYVWKYAKSNKNMWAFSSLLLCLLFGGVLAKAVLKNPVEIISRKQADFINVGKGGVYFINDTCFTYFKSEKISQFQFKGNQGFLKDTIQGEIIHFGSHKRENHCFTPNKSPWDIYYKSTESGSFINITPINESFSQLMQNIPEAFFNVIFRPIPTDPPYSIEKWVVFIETYLILIAIVWGVLRKPKLTSDHKGLLYATSIFIFLLSLIIGWVVPILGAIVRYKIPITIALVFIIFSLWGVPKLTRNKNEKTL